MQVSKTLAFLLSAFALCAVGFAIWKDFAAPKQPQSAPVAPRRIVVYYFHGDAHCSACDRMESLGSRSVDDGFQDEINSGLVVWAPTNTDRKANEHYVSDYRLLTRSIVVAEFKDGKRKRWKNLDRVWDLLDDSKAFTTYVQDEVAAYVGAP
jgi:hypothetical protein